MSLSGGWGPTMFFGRAFECGPTIILPCGFCGTPEFPRRTHICIGHEADREADLLEHLLGGLGGDLT